MRNKHNYAKMEMVSSDLDIAVKEHQLAIDQLKKSINEPMDEDTGSINIYKIKLDAIRKRVMESSCICETCVEVRKIVRDI